ncbi:MAG: flavodoxin family protein [Alistipes sp.]|nr:flavodoxin family protein [Alistipes sp.]MBR2331575.1 flavodoxin family protein [Alistipes sp.]MBR3912138.1 flavodoxin family protein [Alistipes sp.]
MTKRVLILSGSPRKGGNSDSLCEQFAKGAQEAGHKVEKIWIQGKKIAPCLACYYCKDHNGECAIRDDMKEVLDKMMAADVLVLSSPVYFYSISAQLKSVIDRTVARWLEFKNKELYYIMTAAEDSDTVMDCTLECMRGFAECLEGSVEKGIIYGKGVYKKGEIIGHTAMQEAFEMGKNV